jgi:hypothetical protein
MTKIMARILSKLAASGRLQVIHYMSARGFDEGQAYKVLRKIIRRGTDTKGNVSEEARKSARKTFRKMGYKSWLS